MSHGTIYLFRLEDGHRVKYRFDLSKDLTILEETRLGPEEKPSTQLDGVVAHRAAGKTVVTSVDDITQKAMSFFTDNPCCTSAECTVLKQQIDAAMHAAGGSKCTGCARGAVIRKFLPKVREVLQNDPSI